LYNEVTFFLSALQFSCGILAATALFCPFFFSQGAAAVQEVVPGRIVARRMDLVAHV
jgi:hypothetical protein